MTDLHSSTVNSCGGSIEIDGIDTHNVGLKTLRSRLALVPQDNVLFKGTLRQNLLVGPKIVQETVLIHDGLQGSGRHPYRR